MTGGLIVVCLVRVGHVTSVGFFLGGRGWLNVGEMFRATAWGEQVFFD